VARGQGEQKGESIHPFFSKVGLYFGPVKRFRKVLLILLGLLVLAAVGAIVALNLYVQSPGAQARIQAQLSRALGIPIEITSVSIGWSGAQIAGVRVPDGERNLLEANSFSAEYQLLPLLRRQLVIKRMVLETPKVLWAQNADGKWVLPLLPTAGQKEHATLPNAPAPGAQPEPMLGGGFELVLDALEIRNGSIELLDAQQRCIAVATDVNMRYTLRKGDHVEGTLEAKRLVWNGALTFEDVRSPLTFARGDLKLPDLRGRVAGGTAQADLTIQTEQKNSPYSAQITFDRLDLARIAEEGGWEPDQAAGRLNGRLALTGTLKKLDRTEGEGELSLTDGQFKQLQLFQTIGMLLQIPELSDLRVRTGRADFHIKDEKTLIDDLVLETQDLQFSTKGKVGFDGKLGLQAQLAVSQRLAGQLPSFVRNNFTPPDDKGRQSIEFDITGKSDKPKTNLVDRVIGKQINGQIGDFLSGIFGGKPKEEKKDDKKDKDKDKEKKKKKEEPIAGQVPPPPAATTQPPPPSAPPPAAPGNAPTAPQPAPPAEP
jgi:uncharacterized protein involved in outer membrane biogenesis